MRKYSFDVQVNAKYELTDFHISRNGKEICYWDKTSGRVEVTSHGYRNTSPEVKKQAMEMCEKLSQVGE